MPESAFLYGSVSRLFNDGKPIIAAFLIILVVFSISAIEPTLIYIFFCVCLCVEASVQTKEITLDGGVHSRYGTGVSYQ